MSFFAYLSQLKASFNKFLLSNNTKSPKKEDTKYAQESNAKIKSDLKLKCKRAALEIRSIENFTQWPITEIKIKPRNSLVYFDVTRSKQKQYLQNNHIENKVDKVIDKASLTNNVVVIKKLP
jgi:hypothetical protein